MIILLYSFRYSSSEPVMTYELSRFNGAAQECSCHCLCPSLLPPGGRRSRLTNAVCDGLHVVEEVGDLSELFLELSQHRPPLLPVRQEHHHVSVHSLQGHSDICGSSKQCATIAAQEFH